VGSKILVLFAEMAITNRVKAENTMGIVVAITRAATIAINL
jgi:hypothetical protein